MGGRNIKQAILFFHAFFFFMGAVPAWSAPGLFQLASRAGFWGNDFPDGGMLLQHYYYYTYDEVWDGNGNTQKAQDTTVNASFTRIVRAWHFGEDNKYQFILEGILLLYDMSGKETSSGKGDNFSISGLGPPIVYTSVGWNNPEKTTHVQSFLVWQVPAGDSDLMKAIGSNNHALTLGFAVQQRFGNLWVEGAAAYTYNFEDLNSKKKARDAFEINPIVSYRFTSSLPWWIYLQGDYTHYFDGDDAAGHSLSNEGYNVGLAPGIGVQIRPNMNLDIKYAMDLDGKNTSKGNGINARFFWVF